MVRWRLDANPIGIAVKFSQPPTCRLFADTLENLNHWVTIAVPVSRCWTHLGIQTLIKASAYTDLCAAVSIYGVLDKRFCMTIICGGQGWLKVYPVFNVLPSASVSVGLQRVIPSSSQHHPFLDSLVISAFIWFDGRPGKSKIQSKTFSFSTWARMCVLLYG